MKRIPSNIRAAVAAAVVAIALLAGCESDGSSGGGGSADVHASFYYGTGYGYPGGFYGPAYYPPPVVVVPPPYHPGGGGGGSVGPRPTPSMPAARPRGR